MNDMQSLCKIYNLYHYNTYYIIFIIGISTAPCHRVQPVHECIATHVIKVHGIYYTIYFLMISATRTKYKTVRPFSVGYVHAPTSPSVLSDLPTWNV